MNCNAGDVSSADYLDEFIDFTADDMKLLEDCLDIKDLPCEWLENKMDKDSEPNKEQNVNNPLQQKINSALRPTSQVSTLSDDNLICKTDLIRDYSHFSKVVSNPYSNTYINHIASNNYCDRYQKTLKLKRRLELSMCRREISRLRLKWDRNILLSLSKPKHLSMKASDFIYGKRKTLTPELEESRKRLKCFLG